MKIIITGGGGMVGSHCAQYFAKKKNKVVVIDNLMRSTIFGSKKKSVEYNWHYLKHIKNVKLIKEDVRNLKRMCEIFKREKPDAVIHTAGQPGVKYSLDNPLEDYGINSTGTLNILEATKKSNKKATFIYCSTNKVYGHNVNDVPIKELKKRYEFKNIKGINEKFSIDLTGHTPYGVSKLAGDLYVQDYAGVCGMKSAVFRMSCIYGTHQFGFEDQGWLAWFASRYILKKPINIYGDGKQVRDALWVEDLVRAFELYIQSKLKGGEVFNMGGGYQNALSLLELIDHLEFLTDTKVKIKYGPWRKFDQKVYISDTTKVKRALKWKPTVAPQDGIEKLLYWITNNRKLFK